MEGASGVVRGGQRVSTKHLHSKVWSAEAAKGVYQKNYKQLPVNT